MAVVYCQEINDKLGNVIAIGPSTFLVLVGCKSTIVVFLDASGTVPCTTTPYVQYVFLSHYSSAFVLCVEIGQFRCAVNGKLIIIHVVAVPRGQ